MGRLPAESHDTAPASELAASSRPAPGKRTRTAGLPQHHEMTGVDAVDLADQIASEDEADGFTPASHVAAVALVTNATAAMFGALRDGVSNALLDEVTRKIFRIIEWKMQTELGWRAFSAVVTPILGQAMATVANGFAVPAAEIGMTRAAWMLAADAKAMQSVVSTGLTSFRTHLAHPHSPGAMKETVAFLKAIQSAQGAAQLDFMESAMTLRTRDLLGLYSAMRAPAVTDSAVYEESTRRLVRAFSDSRIPEIGMTLPFFGGLDVATVRRVRIRGREYLVLLASHDAERLGSGRNGNGLKPTDHVFLRFVEKELQPLAIDQLKKRQGQRALEGRDMGEVATDMFSGVGERDEVIDFDQASNRGEYPWFSDMYTEHRRHSKARTLDSIAATDEDPYAMHLVEAGDAR